MKYVPNNTITVEAIQWNNNIDEIKNFLNNKTVYAVLQDGDGLVFNVELPDGFVTHIVDPMDYIVRYSDTDYQLFDPEQFYKRFKKLGENDEIYSGRQG